MDDIQIVLYIVFILFALLSRALKKKKEAPKKPVTRSSQPTQSSSEPRKQLTFEELLREFTEGPAPAKQQVHQEEEFDVRDDDEIQRIYQESVRASEEYQKSAKHGDDRHTGNFTHFRGYSEEDTEEETSEFAKLLQDDESAKRAIILSEILNRKY